MKLCLNIFFVGLIQTLVFGQLEEVVRASTHSNQLPKQAQLNLRTAAVDDTLQLPFYDDFSYGGVPSSSKWIYNGGCVISDKFHTNPYSLYSVTFDGWDITGTPYDFFPYTTNASSEIKGRNDTLISKPIDLSLVDSTASLLLGFLYQRGGNSVSLTPDEKDSLRVYFKDADSNWIKVWPNAEDKELMSHPEFDRFTFDTAFIALDKGEYLHAGFQFMFESQGWTTVNSSLWSVNLVALDYNVRDQSQAAAIPLADAGFVELPTPVFSTYHAVPYYQFLADPTSFIGDSIFCTVRNESRLATQYGDLPITIREENNMLTLQSFPSDISSFTRSEGPTIFDYESFSMEYALDKDLISSGLDGLKPPLTISSNYNLTYSDGSNIITSNDSVSSNVLVDSYFAYDDGSAEAGYGIVGYGFFAMEFELLTSDTLRAVSIQMIKDEFDYSQPSAQDLNFRIWQTINGQDGATEDEILYRFSFTITYPDSLEGLDKILLEEPLLLPAGKFYIGYQQVLPEDQSLHLGFDVNNDSRDKVYLKKYESSVWSKSENQVAGSVMIRPYFGQRGIIQGVSEEESYLSVLAFPNPADDVFSINEDCDELIVYNELGQEILMITDYLAGEIVSIDQLRAGLYFIQGKQGERLFQSKFLVIR